MSQYGIRLSRELGEMKFDEFADFLSGLGPDTPLGRVVAIRSEKDTEVIRRFTAEQHRIRNEWLQKKARRMKKEDVLAFAEMLKQTFIGMAGG